MTGPTTTGSDSSDQHFERLVADALDTIPEQLAGLMDNVVVLIEPEPPIGEPDDLLGLYDGIPLTDRDSTYAFVPPDRIFIYQGPLERLAGDDEALLVAEVRTTVVHEIAHHFGIDDVELHRLGYA